MNATAFTTDTARFLAENLVRLRAKHRLSIRVAARKLGVSPSTWSQWETGKHFPPCYLLDLVAKLFSVPPCKLLGSEANCPMGEATVSRTGPPAMACETCCSHSWNSREAF